MSSATLRQNVQSVPAARNQQRQEPAVNGTVPQVKPVVARGVRGHVKWFNVKRGYGFVNRDDNHEDIFIHQTSIARNNPHKYLRSVGDNEPLVFDVVQGEKGLEASNVTGPNGSPVQGSRYAADRPQREFRQRRGQLYGFYRARAAGNGPVVVQPMMTTAAQNLVMGAAPMMSPAAAAAAYIYQQLYGPTIQNQPAPIPAYFVNGQIHPAEMMAPPPPQQPTTNFVSPTSTGTMSSPNNQTSPDLASNDDSPTTPETPRPNLHQQQQPMFPLPTTPAYQPNQSVYYTPPSRSINNNNQRTNGGGYHTTTTTNYAMPPPANPNTFYAGGAWRGRGRRGRRRYYRTPRGGGGRAPPAQIVQ